MHRARRRIPAPPRRRRGTIEQKLAVLSSWTQPNSTSYNGWNAARLNQGAWAEYAFDWSTDFCSTSPDQPLGFDFRLPCWHHDFGYRNYKAMNQFSANKSRIDDTFYFDLKTKCATYNVFVRAPATAWPGPTTRRCGRSAAAAVSTADLNRAAKLKQEA